MLTALRPCTTQHSDNEPTSSTSAGRGSSNRNAVSPDQAVGFEPVRGAILPTATARLLVT